MLKSQISSKKFAIQNGGLSPYTLRILVMIILLGYKIVCHPKHKRKYVFIQDNFIIEVVHSSAINELIKRKHLMLSHDEKDIYLTSSGINLAYKKVKETNMDIDVKEIAQTLHENKIKLINI